MVGQVFDGHGGKHAADFACYHLPRFIFEYEDFPMEIERAVASAFLQTDSAFAEACLLDAALSSGTTALAALVVGRSVLQCHYNLICIESKLILFCHLRKELYSLTDQRDQWTDTKSHFVVRWLFSI